MTPSEITLKQLFYIAECGSPDGSVPDCRHRLNGEPCEELGITPAKLGTCLHPLHPDNLKCKREFPAQNVEAAKCQQ